jgi:hypothetical protein
MPTELKIRDCENALIVTAKQERSPVNGIIGALAAGMFVAIAFSHLLGTLVVVAVTALAASLGLLLGMRQQDTELYITNSGLKSRGRYGDSFRSTRSVSCRDVRWLEYQEDTTGPETSHHPGGLYAVLSGHSVCILPYVDEEQVTEVIQRIVEKFPDLRQQWEGQSPFGEHFTSLGLYQRKAK